VGAELALGLLALAIVLAAWRVLRGPSLADRVVALDAIAAAIVAAAVVLAVRTGQAVFVDVAAAIALVAFLGTVALARVVERGDAP
jgi:multicomponent Na+:H+ antiporter subunit F